MLQLSWYPLQELEARCEGLIHIADVSGCPLSPAFSTKSLHPSLRVGLDVTSSSIFHHLHSYPAVSMER